MVYVRLADQSTRGVPAWMFDPVVCAGVKLAETPLIEYAALIALAELLAQQSGNGRIGGREDSRPESTNQATSQG